MQSIASILLWLVWIILILISGFFTLLLVAFGGDAPQHKRRAQRVVSIGVFAWSAAAFVGFALLSRRESWWEVALALLTAVSPPLACWAAIAVMFRSQD